MKLAILDADALGDNVDLKSFEQFGELEVFGNTGQEQILERSQDKDILILNKVRLSASTLEKLPKLRLVCICATGTDNIDLEYCKEHGIEVKNVKGYSTESVAQLTISMGLALALRLSEQDESGKKMWPESEVFSVLSNPFEDLSGKTWGIIGLGAIGRKVADVAKALGCDVKYYSTTGQHDDPSYERVELDTLLGSDIISVHCPLNSDTKDLINSGNVSLLKDDCVLINVARGGIVNERDIVDHFQKTNIRLGFDVASKEPIGKDNPLLEIKSSKRLILTPHIAWASKQARQKLMEGVKKNIESFIG